MSKLTSPDEWAANNGKSSSWYRLVPDEVRDQLRGTSQGAQVLLGWFRDVVVPAYPKEEWPKQATRARINTLLEKLDAES